MRIFESPALHIFRSLSTNGLSIAYREEEGDELKKIPYVKVSFAYEIFPRHKCQTSRW